MTSGTEIADVAADAVESGDIDQAIELIRQLGQRVDEIEANLAPLFEVETCDSSVMIVSRSANSNAMWTVEMQDARRNILGSTTLYHGQSIAIHGDIKPINGPACLVLYDSGHDEIDSRLFMGPLVVFEVP